MPIYASHNFTENFLNAIGANDTYMQNELIVDEIAKLITQNKREVIDILRNNTINVSVRDNDNKIAKLLTKHIASDPKVRYDITDLIKQKSINMDNLQKFMNDLDTKKITRTDKKGKVQSKTVKGQSNFGNRIRGVVSDDNQHESISNAIAKSLENTFGSQSFGVDGVASNPNSKILEERIKLNKLSNADGDGKWSTKKKIIVIASIALVAIVGGLFAWKAIGNKSAGTSAMPLSPGATPTV